LTFDIAVLVFRIDLTHTVRATSHVLVKNEPRLMQ